jgi:hypothetical protein
VSLLDRITIAICSSLIRIGESVSNILLFPFYSAENDTRHPCPFMLSQIRLPSSQIQPFQHPVYQYPYSSLIVLKIRHIKYAKLPIFLLSPIFKMLIVWHFYVVYLCVYLFYSSYINFYMNV